MRGGWSVRWIVCRVSGVLDLLGEMVEDVCRIAAREGLEDYYCKPRLVVEYSLSRAPSTWVRMVYHRALE